MGALHGFFLSLVTPQWSLWPLTGALDDVCVCVCFSSYKRTLALRLVLGPMCP